MIVPLISVRGSTGFNRYVTSRPDLKLLLVDLSDYRYLMNHPIMSNKPSNYDSLMNHPIMSNEPSDYVYPMNDPIMTI